jgi:YidC/Oxa1 family membrane protein insertase
MSLPVASWFTDIPEAILLFFHDTIGLGWGLSIVALVFLVRMLILPISIKQIRSMRALQALQPQLKEIQQKHKNDKQRQQQEMMRFYQENEINPLASCLPLVLQIPVFISLYYMLRGDSFQQDVAAEPGSEGFLFIPSLIEPPEGAVMVVLIVLFIVTQLGAGLAMSIRGQGLEGPQKFIVFGLPFLFAPFVASFEAGLSVYWISTNLWTLAQQQVVHYVLGPAKKPSDDGDGEAGAKPAKPPPPPPRKKKKRRR